MASHDAAPTRRGGWAAPSRSMTSAPFPDSPLANRFVASPNYGERRGYGRPNSLILHYTGIEPVGFPLARGFPRLPTDLECVV